MLDAKERALIAAAMAADYFELCKIETAQDAALAAITLIEMGVVMLRIPLKQEGIDAILDKLKSYDITEATAVTH